MIILGDSSYRNPGGQACEIHFSVDGRVVAVVHGNLISKWSVQKSDIGTTFIHATLRGGSEAAFGRLPDAAHVDFWVDVQPGGRYCLGSGQIDFWEHKFDKSAESVEFQARGVLAPLIDQPLNQLFTGSLTDLIRQACGDLAPMRLSIDSRQVRAYIDSPSTFGALRLLGVSLGFVVHEESDGIACLSLAEAIKEHLAKPVTVLGPGDVESGNLRRGNPVRRRQKP